VTVVAPIRKLKEYTSAIAPYSTLSPVIGVPKQLQKLHTYICIFAVTPIGAVIVDFVYLPSSSFIKSIISFIIIITQKIVSV
jgi:hypothetical protein